MNDDWKRSFELHSDIYRSLDKMINPIDPSIWAASLISLQAVKPTALESLATAVTDMQHRQFETLSALVRPQLPVTDFLQWVTAEYQPMLLSGALEAISGSFAAQLRQSVLSLDFSTSIVADTLRQFGSTSLLGQQSSSMLNAYRLFADRTVLVDLSDDDEAVQTVSASTAVVATNLLEAATSNLLTATAEDAITDDLELVVPNLWDVLRVQVSEASPRLIAYRDAERIQAEIWSLGAARIGKAAKRFVDAWTAVNNAATYSGHGQFFYSSNVPILHSCELATHVVKDRDGFDKFVDLIFKFVVDAVAQDNKNHAQRHRLFNRSQVVTDVHTLRNHFSHGVSNEREEERSARGAGNAFRRYCGKPYPLSPEDWQLSQLGLLDQLTAQMEGLFQEIVAGPKA